MAATRSSSSDFESEVKIGRVFTPMEWATWSLETCGIYDAWRDGARILDPTCGTGAFFLALANMANHRGDAIHADLVRSLFGIEMVSRDKDVFMHEFFRVTGSFFPPENFITADFLEYEDGREFDIAVGNPPWANFADLPDHFKEKTKPAFEKYGLVKNRKDVLLGASRSDIASLVIYKCMSDHVRAGGRGYFFVPLSLFFNDLANAHFRPSMETHDVFSVDRIVDFKEGFVFPDIGTRNGFVHLSKGKRQESRIPYEELRMDRTGSSSWCFPAQDKGAWRTGAEEDFSRPVHTVRIAEWQQPRQGINTNGLNKAFILEAPYREDRLLDDIDSVRNGFGDTVEMSTRYLFPVANSRTFGRRPPKTQRYVLCLYDSAGRPLDWENIEKEYGVAEYLERYRDPMTNRKGVLIRSQMRKGAYWALIGVGVYTFRKWKVIWESMGKSEFRATVVDGRWQGNQAMHAYISSDSREDATRIRDELNERLPAYLKSFGMEGTCNWAQPGRVKRVLSVETADEQLTMFG